MPGFHGLLAALATACAVYATAAHVVIENDYEEVVDRAAAQKLQQPNECKLVGRGRSVHLGLGLGTSRRKTKGIFKTGMYVLEKWVCCCVVAKLRTGCLWISLMLQPRIHQRRYITG